jgi:hypothetical protein
MLRTLSRLWKVAVVAVNPRVFGTMGDLPPHRGLAVLLGGVGFDGTLFQIIIGMRHTAPD